MQFIYETYGPFSLDRDGNKFRKAAFTKLWEKITEVEPRLPLAIGIYVLAMSEKPGSALIPWYVGKTDKQSFRKRLNEQHSRLGDALDRDATGFPYLFLLARLTPSRRQFMKTRARLDSNDVLETMMIGSCLKRNPHLINTSKAKHPKGLIVPGYLNNESDVLTSAAKKFNRMVRENF